MFANGRKDSKEGGRVLMVRVQGFSNDIALSAWLISVLMCKAIYCH
jgi:hypothetical protein